MEVVKGLLRSLGLNTSSIQDTFVCIFGIYFALCSSLNRTSQKLVVIGGIVETARRALMSAWSGFVDCMYLHSSSEVKCLTKVQRLAFYRTAHFGQEDYPYEW